ncbi:MAG: META domain-containing protein [Chloroflexota bacterium]|nr:META domain-containing protein [Chloroflexota bacterium]
MGRMHYSKAVSVAILILVFLLILSACGSPPDPTPEPTEPSGASPVDDQISIVPLWELLGFDNEGQYTEVLAGTTVTAVFGKDGSLTGTTGCNTYTATYVADEEHLVIGDAAATEMGCLEPQGIMVQESRYLALLPLVVFFEIQDEQLVLSNADRARILVYRASEPQSQELEGQPQLLTVDSLANMTYMSSWTVTGEAPLENGVYRGEGVEGTGGEVVVTLTEDIAYFGLADGEEAASPILKTSTSSGHDIYDLALVTTQDGEAANISTTTLGEDVVINGIMMDKGAIAVDMIQHGPEDDPCCPTERVIRTYVVRRGELVEGSTTVIGTVESQ